MVKFSGPSMSLECKCVRCKADRAVPEGPGRMPSPEQGGAVTVSTDGACACGSKRVRIVLKFE